MTISLIPLNSFAESNAPDINTVSFGFAKRILSASDSLSAVISTVNTDF